MYFIHLYVMFFRRAMTVRRETPWRGRETLLSLELVALLLGKQLPEHKGRQAGQPSNRSNCGTVETAGKERGQTTCQKCEVAERLWCTEGTVQSAKTQKVTKLDLNQAKEDLSTKNAVRSLVTSAYVYCLFNFKGLPFYLYLEKN